MRYRKKPIVIEARQWHKIGDHPEVAHYNNPNLGHQNMCTRCRKFTLGDHGWIQTLEGGFIVCPADWIIKGIKGEYYPCKPDIFDATYEKVEE